MSSENRSLIKACWAWFSGISAVLGIGGMGDDSKRWLAWISQLLFGTSGISLLYCAIERWWLDNSGMLVDALIGLGLASSVGGMVVTHFGWKRVLSVAKEIRTASSPALNIFPDTDWIDKKTRNVYVTLTNDGSEAQLSARVRVVLPTGPKAPYAGEWKNGALIGANGGVATLLLAQITLMTPIDSVTTKLVGSASRPITGEARVYFVVEVWANGSRHIEEMYLLKITRRLGVQFDRFVPPNPDKSAAAQG